MAKVCISKVEETYIQQSGRKLRYAPIEKINIIVVNNFPELGKLAAIRFLEWAQNNEGGTVSLPTGKTPEYFIKYVINFLKTWKQPATRKILEQSGIDAAKKPDMKSFTFIQIDEFYPINTQQHNSFYYYINKYYIQGFGFDAAKALLINPNIIGMPEGETLESIWPDSRVDLELRIKQPRNAREQKQKRVLEAVDQFCTDYESKIRSLGGIGFFLGGVGSDGHIGFNVKGSDHFSTTRLTPINFETQAAAATDLGGIEVARKSLVITIGLRTITHNPQATAIIIASGEAKAQIVKLAVEQPKSNKYPATALQDLQNSSFYLTQGAAMLLTERRYLDITAKEEIGEYDEQKILIDLALRKNKAIKDLTRNDFNDEASEKELFKHIKGRLNKQLDKLTQDLKQRFLSTLDMPVNKVFLHTAPHHDDIALGYLPYLVRLIRKYSNTHYFNYLTSGFTAVSNIYMYRLLKRLKWFMHHSDFKRLARQNYFAAHNLTARNQDMLLFLDGVAANDHFMREKAESKRLLRNLTEVYEEDSFDNLEDRIEELLNYFKTQYPGKKDLPYIQQLKGMTREWEADLLWGYFGFNCSSVIHSRLGFYTGDIFTQEPELERDIIPILKIIEKIKPDVVSVALDPESSGPDTHYKVLQAVTQALKLYNKQIEIWGYRNIWFRFHPADANAFVPVTLNTFAIMNNAFMDCFASQAEASFPSYEYDGPFCKLAQKIQVEQYQKLKTVLGQSFFYENPDSRTRSTRGLVFLKKMNLEELITRSKELRKSTENR